MANCCTIEEVLVCYYIITFCLHKLVFQKYQRGWILPRENSSFYLKTLGKNVPLRTKASFSAASAQLRSCRKASQKLRKSRRYWHLRKSRLLRRAAEKLAFTKLLRNSAEKLQKSQLFYSFYETFTQSFVKIVMMCKSCGNAAITQVPIPPAFAKLLHAAFTQTCVKAAFLQLLRRSALKLHFYSFYADLRKICVSTAFTQVCVKAA